MRNINAATTTGVDGVNIALLTWWIAEMHPEKAVDGLFDSVADEWITTIGDRDVGEAILLAHDFYQEFLDFVARDFFAVFSLREYGSHDTLRAWVAIHLGQHAKKLPKWKTRYPGIRAAQEKLKSVRRVLQS